jgi:hypothetical protein
VVPGAHDTGDIGGPFCPFPRIKPLGGVTGVHPAKLVGGVVVEVVVVLAVVVVLVVDVVVVVVVVVGGEP